jgi:bifunctional DNase/RNase
LLLVVLLGASCDLESAESVERVLKPARRAIDHAQRDAPAPPVDLEPDVVDAPPPVKRGTSTSDASAPEGYVVMTPLARSGDYGNAVLLVHPNDNVVVPIFIGGTEALSIQLRLERRKFTRPLTHDLLDSMMEQLGGKMVRAQVNSLKGGVFIGSVILDRKGADGDSELIELDARPSDAIALAIGNQVPIYVAKDVIAEAGLRPDDVPESQPDPDTPPIAL